jgi:peptidoglycan/xylan/chitin deacetylase (PgdA/CDA1 family)
MAESPFPNGSNIAVVTSWDNGPKTDRILHRKLEEFGYKGTFFVYASKIGSEGYLDEESIRHLIADGHEVGSHGLTDVKLETLAPAEALRQITESKSRLEALFGVPVNGFAYPGGGEAGQDALADMAKQAGYRYARTTQSVLPLSVETFGSVPLYRLPVTAHYQEDFFSIQSKWDEIEDSVGAIFHLWGHTEVFGDDPHDWLDFDCILGFLGGISRVWYCTLGELVDHLRGGE